jgi:hypothetical protein
MGHITRPFQFLKLVAAGVMATALGVWLLVNPNLGMRDAPPPTAADYMPGVGALAVGLILLAFAAWVFFRRPDSR